MLSVNTSVYLNIVYLHGTKMYHVTSNNCRLLHDQGSATNVVTMEQYFQNQLTAQSPHFHSLQLSHSTLNKNPRNCPSNWTDLLIIANARRISVENPYFESFLAYDKLRRLLKRNGSIFSAEMAPTSHILFFCSGTATDGGKSFNGLQNHNA